MISNRVEDALAAEGAERLALVAAMTGRELQAFLGEYNWDDGIEPIRVLARNPNCELAVALEAFWLMDPSFETVPPAPSRDKDYDALVRELYDGILSSRFRAGELTFKPLSETARVYRAQLEKRGVPAVFLDGVG